MIHSAGHVRCIWQKKIKRGGTDTCFQVPEVPVPNRENAEYQRQIGTNCQYSRESELVVRTPFCHLIRIIQLRRGRNLGQGAKQNVTWPHLRTAQTLFDRTARSDIDHQIKQQRSPQKKHSATAQIRVQQRTANNRRIE